MKARRGLFNLDSDLDAEFSLHFEGPVWVTSDANVWSGARAWLVEQRDYSLHDWQLASKTEFFGEVSETFNWEAQFGYALWTGNLDALNDGVIHWEANGAERVLISIDNAEQLQRWLAGKSASFWDILHDMARAQLLLGTGLLILAKVDAPELAEEWAKLPFVNQLLGFEPD